MRWRAFAKSLLLKETLSSAGNLPERSARTGFPPQAEADGHLALQSVALPLSSRCSAEKGLDVL